MAIQSLADFYESWFPTTSLRQTLEQATNLNQISKIFNIKTNKWEKKTPENRQAFIDTALEAYKRSALLGGDPSQLRGIGFWTDEPLRKRGLTPPTAQEFYDQLAGAYSGYLDTAATQLEEQLTDQEAQFEQAAGQFEAETAAAKAEAERAQRASLVAKRLTSLAQERQSQQTAKQAAEQSTAVQTGVSRNVRQPKQIGQPGVQVTKVSKAAVGGYGGTAPGRINPTGLNI